VARVFPDGGVAWPERAESNASTLRRLNADPRPSEVVRTSRFNAEDAEFRQEETEELSRVLTAYRDRWMGTGVGLDGREPALGAGRAAVEVAAGEVCRPASHGLRVVARSGVWGGRVPARISGSERPAFPEPTAGALPVLARRMPR
jgi:hypothetical protein